MSDRIKVKVMLCMNKTLTKPEPVYTITRITGAATINVQEIRAPGTGIAYIKGRVKDDLTEKQAEELAQRVEVTTVYAE